MIEEKPKIVKIESKEVFDEFFYEGVELFKKISENQTQILVLQHEIADYVTEYIDMVKRERGKRKKIRNKGKENEQNQR